MMTNLQEKHGQASLAKIIPTGARFHLKSLTVCIKENMHKQGGDEHQVFIGIGA